MERLLRPQSIAFIGGQQVSGSIRVCKRSGYKGELYSVNPTRDEIEGLSCFATLEQLPVVPDAAVVGLSPLRSIEAIETLRAMGCGGAVVMTSGFAEMGDDGTDLQDKLIAAAGSMPLLGPNCMGMLNQFDGAAVWGDDNHMERPKGNGAAIISQSGAMLIGITNVEQAFPLGYAISVGNQAVTTIANCLEGVLADERVTAIGIYVEGINDGNALGQACLAAARKGIPVFALKGGDFEAGAAAAMSHTAAMVVERDLWEAFCRRYCIVEVSSPKALVEVLKLASVGGIPNANRVSILSYSGGLNGLAAAKAGPMGMDLTLPTDENRDKLKAMLPETVHIANPLDLNIPFTARSGMSMQNTGGVAEAIYQYCEAVTDQIVFFIDIPRPNDAGLDMVWQASLEALVEVKARLKIPVSIAGILPEGLSVEYRHSLIEKGISPLLGFIETMEAISATIQYRKLYNSHTNEEQFPRLYASVPDGGVKLVNEKDSKEKLGQFGLYTPKNKVLSAPFHEHDTAELKYPVTLKVLSNEIAHKARVGGVCLNLRNAEELASSLETMIDDLTKNGHGEHASTFLVEEMIQCVHSEVIVGIKRHPSLGMALVVGSGGGKVEELRHFETVLLPLINSELDDALSTLGLADRNKSEYVQLRDAIQSICNFVDAHHEKLIGIDVNPILLTHDGEAIAADAMILTVPGATWS